MSKLTVVGGGGALGSEISSKVADRGLVDELLLLDLKDPPEIGKKLIGNAFDIDQSTAFTNNTATRHTFEYADVIDSDIIVVTAGLPRKPGITREQLAGTNYSIVKSISSRLNGFNGIVVTLTNPMDLMNYFLWREMSGEMKDRHRFVGSGGQLDSSRLKEVLKVMYKTRPDAIEAFVIGVHGESMVPLLSRVSINGKKISFSEDEKTKIIENVRLAGINVIENKGATTFAPAGNTADMIACILKNQKRTMTCSVVLNGEYGVKDMSIGVPVMLGKDGVEKILEWKIEPDEKELFDRGVESLNALKNTLVK